MTSAAEDAPKCRAQLWGALPQEGGPSRRLSHRPRGLRHGHTWKACCPCGAMRPRQEGVPDRPPFPGPGSR